MSREPSASRRAAGALGVGAEVLVWWALMVGVWDVTLSGSTVPDVVAAAVAGLGAAIAAVAGRRLMGLGGRPRAGWLRWLPVLAGSVLADSCRALALAVRHVAVGQARRLGGARDVRGRFVRTPLEHPACHHTECHTECGDAELHRGLATLVVTSTPGAIVYDEDPDEHCLLEHNIVDGRPDLEATVAR